MVLIQHDGRSLQRLEGVAVLNKTSHYHRVDLAAGREYQGEAREHVALVVVRDCIGHIQCVCLVRIKVAFKCNLHAFTLEPVLRSFLQRRGQENALCILYLYIFIELEIQLCLMGGNIDRSHKRLHFRDHWRYGILRTSARWRSGICARMRKYHRAENNRYRYCRPDR